MLEVLCLVSVAFASAYTPSDSERPAPQSEVRALWMHGVSYSEFARRAQRHEELAAISSALTLQPHARRALSQLVHKHRLLVIADPRCDDSVQNLPYMNAIAAFTGSLELRIVTREMGAPLLDRFRTPDNREATPTMLVMDRNFAVVGCWIERPRPLQDWIVKAQKASSRGVDRSSKP